MKSSVKPIVKGIIEASLCFDDWFTAENLREIVSDITRREQKVRAIQWHLGYLCREEEMFERELWGSNGTSYKYRRLFKESPYPENFDKIYTDEEETLMLRLNEEGVPVKEIAKQLGRTLGGVRYKLWKMNKNVG